MSIISAEDLNEVIERERYSNPDAVLPIMAFAPAHTQTEEYGTKIMAIVPKGLGTERKQALLPFSFHEDDRIMGWISEYESAYSTLVHDFHEGPTADNHSELVRTIEQLEKGFTERLTIQQLWDLTKVDKSLLNVINAITYGSTFQLPPEIDPAFA